MVSGGRLPALLALRTRRRGLVLSAVAVAAAGIASPLHSASAARGWCRTDPLILINGELADIFCTAPLSMLLQATGPTEFVVTVPRGVQASLVLAGPGFLKGERIEFEHSRKLEKTKLGIEVKIEVRVPAREDLPIGVEFAPRILGILNPDRAEGFANSWVTLNTIF